MARLKVKSDPRRQKKHSKIDKLNRMVVKLLEEAQTALAAPAAEVMVQEFEETTLQVSSHNDRESITCSDTFDNPIPPECPQPSLVSYATGPISLVQNFWNYFYLVCFVFRK